MASRDKDFPRKSILSITLSNFLECLCFGILDTVLIQNLLHLNTLIGVLEVGHYYAFVHINDFVDPRHIKTWACIKHCISNAL